MGNRIKGKQVGKPESRKAGKRASRTEEWEIRIAKRRLRAARIELKGYESDFGRYVYFSSLKCPIIQLQLETRNPKPTKP